jgi:hypothetical protein
MVLMPWVVGVSMLISAPLSWIIAPRLRARFWNPHAHGGTPVARQT